LAVLWGVGLAGCATTAPEAIRENPPGNPSVAEVRTSPDRFAGERVRWGGTIANVENRQRQTWIEIVARELDNRGRPTDGDTSYGRFIARLDGFVDPAIYSKDREITVVGNLAKALTRNIGKHPYRFPVVDVATHHLWAREQAARPYYYDPFWYDPWYPYYYRPYPWSYRPYW